MSDKKVTNQIDKFIAEKDAEQAAWVQGRGYREEVEMVHDQILIRKFPNLPESAGGIILSQKATAEVNVNQGQVIAVGPGKRVEGSKEVVRNCVSAGQYVTFGQFAGTNTVKINGEVLLILTDNEITGVYRRTPAK